MSELHDRSRGVPLGTRAPFSFQTPDGGALRVLAAELRCAHVASGQQEVQLTILLPSEERQITLALRPEVAQLLFAVCADVNEMKDFLEELGPGSLFRRTGSWVLVEPRAPVGGCGLFASDRNRESGDYP